MTETPEERKLAPEKEAVLSLTFRIFHRMPLYAAVQKMSSAAMISKARSIVTTARPSGPARVHCSFQSDQ
jgi:hypothetical protein